MYYLFYAIAILMAVLYIYIPVVCLYGIVKLMEKEPIDNVICNPFFGLRKTSLKTGFIAWVMQCLFLGGIISDLYLYHFHGMHPFFLDYLSL